jgi:hypothetical protein
MASSLLLRGVAAFVPWEPVPREEEEVVMGRDRRRYPRVGVTLDVTVAAPGSHWQGKTVDLSPYGVKVTSPAPSVKLPPGSSVRLQLALPDGDSPLSLTATVVRTALDGVALNFVNLEAQHFERLKNLVDALLASLTNGSEHVGMQVRVMKERRKHPRIDAELDIAFEAEKPYDWRGKTINLSPFGVKVGLPASAIRPSEGTSVQLRLAAPDAPSPMAVKGMVWRREPKTTTLLFVDLGREEIERLKALVESLRA